jgi:predicted nucleotidyltransferase
VNFVRPIEAIVPGARGSVLAVLAETTAELNLRTIAQLAGISQAQASRVLPDLVDLGVVERREVPPASLFRLVPEHVASRALLSLARATDTVLEEIGRLASELPTPPASVIVFGSLARREAVQDSDIDVVVVRPSDVEEDDDAWAESIERWRRAALELTGNRVEVLEVSTDEVAKRVAGRSELWTEIRREGRVVHGLALDELQAAPIAWARSDQAGVGRPGALVRRQGR